MLENKEKYKAELLLLSIREKYRYKSSGNLYKSLIDRIDPRQGHFYTSSSQVFRENFNDERSEHSIPFLRDSLSPADMWNVIRNIIKEVSPYLHEPDEVATTITEEKFYDTDENLTEKHYGNSYHSETLGQTLYSVFHNENHYQSYVHKYRSLPCQIKQNKEDVEVWHLSIRNAPIETPSGDKSTSSNISVRVKHEANGEYRTYDNIPEKLFKIIKEVRPHLDDELNEVTTTITEEEFYDTYENLTEKQHDVLLCFLRGMTDKEGATELNMSEPTFRKQISNICIAFKLKNQPGQRRLSRHKLKNLFRKHRPELLIPQSQAEQFEVARKFVKALIEKLPQRYWKQLSRLLKNGTNKEIAFLVTEILELHFPPEKYF